MSPSEARARRRRHARGETNGDGRSATESSDPAMLRTAVGAGPVGKSEPSMSSISNRMNEQTKTTQRTGNVSKVEPSCTKNALSDLVVPAIDEEKSTLLGTQNTRPTTIEMTEKPVAEDDGVLRRERPSTLRADPRLLFHPDSRQQAGCQRARCRQTP